MEGTKEGEGRERKGKGGMEGGREEGRKYVTSPTAGTTTKLNN